MKVGRLNLLIAGLTLMSFGLTWSTRSDGMDFLPGFWIPAMTYPSGIDNTSITVPGVIMGPFAVPSDPVAVPGFQSSARYFLVASLALIWFLRNQSRSSLLHWAPVFVLLAGAFSQGQAGRPGVMVALIAAGLAAWNAAQLTGRRSASIGAASTGD